jgi:hypothetical protein
MLVPTAVFEVGELFLLYLAKFGGSQKTRLLPPGQQSLPRYYDW